MPTRGSAGHAFERPGIACPHCGWRPYVGAQWVCAPDGCGTAWDTFETGARCPGCDAQFVWTDCFACGRRSPHADWYRAVARA